MKTKSTVKQLLVATALSLLIAGCKKDKDQIELPQPILNSPELITSLALKFTDSSATGTVIMAEFRDPDGPGGNLASKFDTIKLKPNKTYFLDVIVLDETKNPIDTVSKEILKEKNDHQFFFTHTGVNISTSYLDSDDKGYPVGLRSKWRTKEAGTGTSKIVLKHQVGIKNGTEAPGETDIEVSFQTRVN